MENNTSDDELFKEYMKGVKPLLQNQHTANPSRKKFTKIYPPIEKRTPTTDQYIYDPYLVNQDNWLTGEGIACFSRNGIAEKTLKSLRSGKIPWELQLDLHRHTAAAAMNLVDTFLAEALSKYVRCVLIVHGKGTRMPEQKPILKNILMMHLRDNSNVLAYHSARSSDGGTGAIYVYLRSQQI